MNNLAINQSEAQNIAFNASLAIVSFKDDTPEGLIMMPANESMKFFRKRIGSIDSYLNDIVYHNNINAQKFGCERSRLKVKGAQYLIAYRHATRNGISKESAFVLIKAAREAISQSKHYKKIA